MLPSLWTKEESFRPRNVDCAAGGKRFYGKHSSAVYGASRKPKAEGRRVRAENAKAANPNKKHARRAQGADSLTTSDVSMSPLACLALSLRSLEGPLYLPVASF